MNNAKWDEYAQIRDMCPQSEFIKKYVLEEKPYYYKVADGTKTSITIHNYGSLIAGSYGDGDSNEVFNTIGNFNLDTLLKAINSSNVVKAAIDYYGEFFPEITMALKTAGCIKNF